jgi:uncharacterized repeat protein (TIGR01451 family)
VVGRSIGLDVHRDFCEVAIAQDGQVRSAGRVETTPERLELFAASLVPRDRVALEVSGGAWEVARILEGHVARVTANNSATAQTTVTLPPLTDQAITKSDSPDPAVAGEILTYTIGVSNSGPDRATGVSVTDTLPAMTTFLSAKPSQRMEIFDLRACCTRWERIRAS